MKKSLGILIAVLLGLSTLSSFAETSPTPTTQSKTPGVAIAQQISLLTGIAISPLMGSSAYGCYLWWKTPEAQRASLPWFAQWWFWAPGLLIVAICFIKDTAG